MCMDAADLLPCFHLSARCEVFKTQAAGSKQVWATGQPPDSSTLHTCVLIQSSQKPRPRRLLCSIEGEMEGQRLDNLNKVTIRKTAGPTLRFMLVEFLPLQSTGQTAGTFDLPS